MKKSEQIKLAESSQVRRRGVDKAALALTSPMQSQDIMEDDLPATQLMDDNDEAIMESDDVDVEDFNERADQLFLDRTDEWLEEAGRPNFDQRSDRWFAEYAPKLFDLAIARYLTKKDKLGKKTEESSETSQPRRTKKKKS